MKYIDYIHSPLSFSNNYYPSQHTRISVSHSLSKCSPLSQVGRLATGEIEKKAMAIFPNIKRKVTAK